MVGIIGFKVVVMTAVVVGAGFSGVIAARELVRAGWQVVLIDPGARPGRGLA
jgi:monoamine oxidase